MLFENKKYKMYTVNKHRIVLIRDDDNRFVETARQSYSEEAATRLIIKNNV